MLATALPIAGKFEKVGQLQVGALKYLCAALHCSHEFLLNEDVRMRLLDVHNVRYLMLSTYWNWKP